LFQAYAKNHVRGACALVRMRTLLTDFYWRVWW